MLDNTHILWVTFLLQEKRNPDSNWAKYIDILPKSFETFPVFWSQEDLSWLDHTDLIRLIIDWHMKLKTDYETICAAIPEYAEVPFREYQEMRVCVDSRLFSFRKDGVSTTGLIPCADMLNH